MSYRKGRAYEHEVAELLRRDGYEVMRSAGSKGAWDLHARKQMPGSDRQLWIAVYVQAKVRAR